jgi:hypothetical protein
MVLTVVLDLNASLTANVGHVQPASVLAFRPNFVTVLGQWAKFVLGDLKEVGPIYSDGTA